jgi:hypothetical protein
MYSYNFNLLPSSYSNTWTTNFDRRGRENLDQPMLRNDSDYYVPFACTVTICNQPLIYYPKLWNEFTDPCKYTSNKSIFKKELKNYFLDKLVPNFVCDRLLQYVPIAICNVFYNNNHQMLLSIPSSAHLYCVHLVSMVPGCVLLGCPGVPFSCSRVTLPLTSSSTTP